MQVLGALTEKGTPGNFSLSQLREFTTSNSWSKKSKTFCHLQLNGAWFIALDDSDGKLWLLKL
jgi:hypothetical protein